MPIPNPSSREDFKIAIICALMLEAKAVLPLFDTTYDENLDEIRKLDEDENAYVLGSIGKYHVALVILPGAGKTHASSMSSAAKRSYPGLELALVVGVCGGVPYQPDPMSSRRDIFLGDVIVSNGVVQHDLGRRYEGEFIRKDDVHSNLGRPSRRILAFVNKLDLVYEQLVERLASYLVKVQGKFPSIYPGAEKDQLFSSEYPHAATNCRCADIPCQDGAIVARRREPSHQHQTTSVHFGLVASGDTVMKSAKHRDEISAKENIIGFEMEGAGVWDNLPCIVVKGVCDYSDSHKNKDWQFFAAASAAACARAILDKLPVSLAKPLAEDSQNPNQGVTLSSRKRPATDISKADLGEVEMDDEFYLDSLTFPQAQFRLQEISTAHKKTCQWIVGQPQYLSWMNEEAISSHGGFFWIKGKPGAGKSTMMKYLLQRAKQTFHDTVILSFFFHAQGIILERSVMGMYRSLLHQLLCSKKITSDARKPFLDLVKGLKVEDGAIAWTKREVKNLLYSTIKSVKGHRILILIDAVDECNKEEVKDMTSFFQELGHSACSWQVNLRICLASRHYPHVSLDRGIELIIEDQQEHEADLEKYVASELKGGRSKSVQAIRDNICARASGVFLWVVLVVRTLNEAFDRGKISGLQKRLDEIPDGLDDLFTDILTRDQEDKNALVLSLQLVLFSRRILTREELYFAVLFETTGSIEMDIDWNLHSTTVMDRRIIDVAKGLAETSKAGRTKDKSYRVRFIHESVRDFLLQRNGFSRIQSSQINPTGFIGVSHNNLKGLCFRYIAPFCHGLLGEKIEELAQASRKSRPHEAIQTAFPFLDYAIRNVLGHSNSAQAGGISQEGFLEEYSQCFSASKSIFNAVERFATRQYKDDESLLYVMAEAGLHDLIPLELLGKSHAWDICGQYICPMGAALHKGSMASVRALLGMRVEKSSCNLSLQIESELIIRMEELFVELAQQVKQNGSKAKHTQLLVKNALEGGDVSILRLLLRTNAIDFNDSLPKTQGQTPLHWSISNSKPHLLEFLLFEAKVDVETVMRRAEFEKSPLLRLAFKRLGYVNLTGGWKAANKRIFDTLLRQDSFNPKCEDQDGRNAVHWAVLSDDKRSVSQLINHGFDYEHCDYAGRDPLSYAAERGYTDVLQVLLEIENINANRHDLSGRTPASWASVRFSMKNGPAMMEALSLSEKVDFNVKDRYLKSPLAEAAAAGGDPRIIEFLLRLDIVDVNSRDMYGRTPLTLAVLARNLDQVKALVQCDRVDIDAQDDDGRTALSWAIGPVNFLWGAGRSVSLLGLSCVRGEEYDTIWKALHESRIPNSDIADNWGHAPVWWARAHAIVLDELASKFGIPIWKPSCLEGLAERFASRCTAAIPIDLKTIKAQMQSFLEGEHVMKSPTQWNLKWDHVKFSGNWTLEGTFFKEGFDPARLY